jgi:nucleoside-diphosphate-sugar epimerase
MGVSSTYETRKEPRLLLTPGTKGKHFLARAATFRPAVTFHRPASSPGQNEEAPMKVFVAGGTGTIGVPLVRALVAAGHEVTALTRTAEKAAGVRALGARAAVADALDADALARAVLDARPTHVIHQLTALPRDGITRAEQLTPTNRLRDEGTRNLLAAAVRAGAGRFVAGSFAPLVGVREPMPRGVPEAVNAVRSMEAQVIEAARHGLIGGVVLRYGLWYGPGNPMTEKITGLVRRRLMPVVRNDQGLLPWIHQDDVVAATVAALDRGRAGEAYDIVDDQPASMSDMVREIARRSGAPRPIAVPAWVLRLASPYMAGFLSLRLALSNEKARADLGWRPAYATLREGVSQLVLQAA